MAFDREKFFRRADNGVSASALVATADELAALHAEVAALKAAMPAPEPRETGWAVVDSDGDPFCKDGFASKKEILGRSIWVKVIWFEDEDGANAFARAISKLRVNPARIALLYKDTLEPVGGKDE